MQVRVLTFAALREALGAKEIFLEVRGAPTVGEVLTQLESQQPVIARYRGRLLVAVNRARVPLDTPIREGDEIALLPPVSGGSGLIRIQPEPLSLDELVRTVVDPSCGAIATFTGVVRNVSRGRGIAHLEYEAYEPMAHRELERIRDEILERWPGVRLAVAHRIGRLEIGEAAVVIAVAAPHRAEALEACRYAIDTLKRSVPIWKKEFDVEGGSWVEENP
ncbi:MAG: molybdenum cofactor biosynthesis protein MoaE [Myxococcota bacterium]